MKTYSAYRRSRSCGEDVTLSIDVHDGEILSVRSKGDYSKVCEASIDALIKEADKYTLKNMHELVNLSCDLLENKKPLPEGASEALKKMSHLRFFPNRVPAAKLPWQALDDILSQIQDERHAV